MKKASIIIPAYNEEKYIEKTLKSIKKQNYKDFEIIVVCNGCTDQTAKIAKKYTKNVYNIKRKGVSIAKNFGAKKAKSKILIFLDADTILSKKVLEEISKTENKFGTCIVKPIEKKLKYKILYSIKNLLCNRLKLINGILYCKQSNFKKAKGYKNTCIGENRPLIRELEKVSKYELIREPVKTSMRRYEKNGLVKSALIYIINYLKRNKEHKPIR